MVYVLATLKLQPGKLQDFMRVVKEMMPIIESHGWKLVGSYAMEIGHVNTVVDLWEVPDYNAARAGLFDPRFEQWEPEVKTIIQDEQLQILSKLPI